MSETGQPGAATPGEHGDGPGQQDDLARSVSGWAPPAAGWSRGGEAAAAREPVSPWRQPDPTSGWGASSPRHGDLPAPLGGRTADPEPSARANGRPHVNGVSHAGEESPVGRQTPVSAPPGLGGDQRLSGEQRFDGDQRPGGEPRRDADGDRLVVPAQRPAPAAEQPTGPQRGAPELDAGAARHVSDDPPAARPTRWAEAGTPSSAPPAMQVPPVGTAASGFEIPPGFRAPTLDRPGADASAADQDGWATDDTSRPTAGRRGWSAAETPPADPGRPDWGTADVPPSAAAQRGWGDPFPPEPPADPAGADRFPPEPPADPVRADGPPAPSADEPARTGPNWNRPSWGSGWAPPWGRQDKEPVGRRAREDRATDPTREDRTADRAREDWAADWTRDDRAADRSREDRTADRAREDWAADRTRDDRAADRSREDRTADRAREDWAADRTRDDRAADRTRDDWAADRSREDRAREDRAAEWAPEAGRYEPVRSESNRPYEPVRAEPSRPYDGTRSEPGHPYQVDRPTADPRAGYDAPAGPSASSVVDRPSWAGGRPAAAPSSGPPVPDDGTTAGAGATASAAERAPVQPFRLRPAAPGTTPSPSAADDPGHPPAPTGPGAAAAPATSGVGRLDRTPPAPAPTSAPPYAARRSAPDPAPTAEPVLDDRQSDRAPAVLPQRVPAEPDVPVVPEPPAVEPPAESPELARIATHLRRDDEPAPLRERPEGFDVNAILDAVREVAGVRDAALRRTPAGAHSLRLDLADGADPAEVSRQVARLLQERMGLAAAPQNVPGMSAVPPPPVRRRSAEARAAEGRPTAGRTPEGRTPEGRSVGRAPEGRTAEGRAPEGRASEGRVVEGRTPEGGVSASRAAENRAIGSRVGEQRVTDDGATGGSALGGPAAEGRAFGAGAAPTRTDGAPTRTEAAPAEAASTRAERRAETTPETPRRRRQGATHRGRASVEEPGSVSAVPAGMATGSPATVGTSYSGGQMSTTETAPSRPLDPRGTPGPRVVIDQVLVSTFGLDATVEVRLLAGRESAEGFATGPAVDGYVLRLCAVAAGAAVDELLRGAEQASDRGRCFVEHAAVVPFGNCEVATVVVLLVCDGWVEQLAGSALVAGDPRQAVVRATLAAVNRRLEALLA